MTRLRLLAVDGDPAGLALLTHLLRAQPGVVRVLSAGDAAGALRILEDDAVDAVFAETQLPRLSGLDLAKILARFAAPPRVVFVTGHPEFAVTAFELGALDYLLKPVRQDRLAESVRRVAVAVAPSSPRNDDATIPVELAGSVRLVHRYDVRYVEAAGDYVRLHTSSGSHLVRTALAVLEEQWRPAGFVRVHRSYLVNLAHVDELHHDTGHYSLRLRGHDHSALPVSRRHGRDIRERLLHGAPGPALTG